MRLATLSSRSEPDGELILVNQAATEYVRAHEFEPSLPVQSLRLALEHWSQVAMPLMMLSQKLDSKQLKAHSLAPVQAQLQSCLPRTFLFADGSAFIHHIKLVRKARKAELPETLSTVPLIYQGEGGKFLKPTEDIPQIDFAHGTDFEAEIGVITDFVPMGVKPEAALQHIKLICLINDVSLRGLIPAELAQGFGFFQSKPASALSPFACTPEELGADFVGGRVQLPIHINLNKKLFGKPNAKEMHFHFGQLIAHAARTRDLPAGSLIGSGTVSNEESSVGSGCLAEIRTLEQIAYGAPKTPFMKVGDSVEIWMESSSGRDLFGRISQKVADFSHLK